MPCSDIKWYQAEYKIQKKYCVYENVMVPPKHVYDGSHEHADKYTELYKCKHRSQTHAFLLIAFQCRKILARN